MEKGAGAALTLANLGREALIEMLNIDTTVRQIIYEGSMTELHRYLSESGFQSFQMAAIEKVTTGRTTVDEVLRVLPHSALYRKRGTIAPNQTEVVPRLIVGNGLKEKTGFN